MRNQESAPELVTVAEAAQILRVSRSTLMRLARAGAFPVIRTARRRLGIRRADLDRYLTKREVLLGANTLAGDAGRTVGRLR